MENILKSETLNAALKQKGYVIIPFLNSTEVTSLKEAYQKSHPNNPDGFYATTHANDVNFRKHANEQIKAVLDAPIKKNIQNINALGGAFISKSPNQKGVLPLHQDWNIVNEDKYQSYNIWIPLQDVDEYNGAVRVLERSHNKMKTYRGPNIPPILANIADEVQAHMISLNMKAGEALIYNHALWHSSPINQSDQHRLAVVYGIIPKAATMMYYYRNKKSVEEYISNLDFFFNNNPERGPQGLTKTRTIPHTIEFLNKESFQQVYLDNPFKKNKSIASIIIKLFKSKK